MGLRANLLNVVLKDLPNANSVLGEPSARWDELLGGRTGPNSWGRYGRGAGTTCLIVANGWAIDAGFPDDMVITTPTPSGGGVPVITAQINGAKTRGWLHTPVQGELPNLRPGDIYNINHVNASGNDGLHEGVVLSATLSPDGQMLTVETADGGQKDAQGREAATRQVRTFMVGHAGHAVEVNSKFGNGWLERYFAVGGDTPDDVLDAPKAVSSIGTGGAPVRAPGGGAPVSTTPHTAIPLWPALLVSAGAGIFIYGLVRVSMSDKRKY